MMKKSGTMVVALMMAVGAHAQFEEGKVYVGASLTGINLNYNGNDGFNLGAQAHVGYLCMDNLMLLGQVGYEHKGTDGMPDKLTLGVAGRYYIIQNGLYLGAGCKLVHANHNYNDVMPGVEVGYAFFLSRTVTVEPAIYYDQSFKDHSNYSTIGLKIGIGVYL